MTKAITNLTFNYSSELLSELTSKRWRSNSITVTTRRLEFKHSAPTNTRTGNFHQWDQTNSLQVFGSHVNFFNLELHKSTKLIQAKCAMFTSTTENKFNNGYRGFDCSFLIPPCSSYHISILQCCHDSKKKTEGTSTWANMSNWTIKIIH